MGINPRQIINLPAGVNKNDNSYTSMIWSDADKMRFYKGFPEKIGGWITIDSQSFIPLQGAIRSMFNFIDAANNEHLLIGSSWGLFDYLNNEYYNITPIDQTSSSAIPNSLSTNYGLVGNNALTSVLGNNEITLTVSPFNVNLFRAGDLVTISGATAFNGILAPSINDFQIINSVDTGAGTISFTVADTATSSGTGGGAAINLATKVISVSDANAFEEYWRIAIAGSTDVGGILLADINAEHIIRNRTALGYDIYIADADYATSSVAAGGGAAVTVKNQIAAGEPDYKSADGYGGGFYGLDDYGIGSPFGTGSVYPTIWSFGNFPFYDAGTTLTLPGVALTQGYNSVISSGTYPYIWGGDTAVAPRLSTDTAGQKLVNFLFTSHGQVVTFGADTTPNKIKTCSNSDFDKWALPSADPSSNAYETIIGTAGRFIGRSSVRDRDLIFTENGTYEFVYVGPPLIWITREITLADGLIAPFANASINDYTFWMGQNDIYMYNGSTFQDVPNNTLKQWIFENLNRGKAYKSFCFMNLAFNEIWFFFPYGDTDEPNAYAIFNYSEGHWTNGFMTRTAAELPLNEIHYNYMANSSVDPLVTPILYEHEVGYGDGDVDVPFETSLSTNYGLLGNGENMQLIDRVIPSSRINYGDGDVTSSQTLYEITLYTKEYDGNSVERSFGPYNISLNTNKVDVRGTGRQRKYIFTSNTIDSFRIEKWYEEVKELTRR